MSSGLNYVPRHRGHLVARISWTRLEVECTCSALVTAESEADLMAAFSTHRRIAVPELEPPTREPWPPLVITAAERQGGW